jgi:hypothetical protein
MFAIWRSLWYRENHLSAAEERRSIAYDPNPADDNRANGLFISAAAQTKSKE